LDDLSSVNSVLECTIVFCFAVTYPASILQYALHIDICLLSNHMAIMNFTVNYL